MNFKSEDPAIKDEVDQSGVVSTSVTESLSKPIHADLKNCPFVFNYRKTFSIYLRKYGFYKNARKMLKEVLNDELQYYQLETELGNKTDVSKIGSLSNLKYSLDDEDFILKVKSAPHLAMARTHYLIGKVQSNMGFEKSVMRYKIAEAIAKTVYGNSEHMLIAKINLRMKEAIVKNASARIKNVLNDALEYAQTA